MKDADLVITGEGVWIGRRSKGKRQPAWRDWHESSESQCSQLLAVHLKIENFAKFLTVFTKTRARE